MRSLSGQALWWLHSRLNQAFRKPRWLCDAMCTMWVWHLAYINTQHHLVMSLVSSLFILIIQIPSKETTLHLEYLTLSTAFKSSGCLLKENDVVLIIADAIVLLHFIQCGFVSRNSTFQTSTVGYSNGQLLLLSKRLWLRLRYEPRHRSDESGFKSPQRGCFPRGIRVLNPLQWLQASLIWQISRSSKTYHLIHDLSFTRCPHL